MKKFLIPLFILLLTVGIAQTASSTPMTWEDYDRVGSWVYSGDTDYYFGLNISVADNFRPGIDVVETATVSFWLDDDGGDGYEYAYAYTRGTGWVYAGEVDYNEVFGPFSVTGTGIDQLNDTGIISVGIHSSGGDFWWDAAKVVATGYSPVPEPGTIMLFGIGLLGLAGASRRKD